MALRSRKGPNGETIWFVDYYDAHGIRRRKDLPATSKREAEKQAATITANVARDRAGLPRQLHLVLLDSLLREDAERPGIVEKTRKNERTYRADLCRVLGPNLVVSTITHEMLVQFQRVRHNEGVNPNKALAYLAMAMRRAIRSGRLQGMPCMFPVRLPYREKIRNVLSQEQVFRVANMMAEPWRQAALLLYLLGGARPGELARMKPEDIDRENGLITLHGTKRGAGLSSRSRQIPFSQQATEVFDSLPPAMKKRGKPCLPITRSNEFRKALAEAGEHAEIAFRVTPYTLRYSAATNMQTDDLGTVKRALGHSTIKLTADIYRQTPDSKLREAMDSLSYRSFSRRDMYRDRFRELANARGVQAAIDWLLDVASGVQDQRLKERE